MKSKELILSLIENKGDVNGVLVMIDFLFRIGQLNLSDKLELLLLLKIDSNYDILMYINNITDLYNSSELLDYSLLEDLLDYYKIKSVINQAKVDEILGQVSI